MAQPIPIPILAGTLVDPSTGAPRVNYPVNMVPVPGQDNVLDGFLKPAEGIVSFAAGIGADRGGIVWNKDGKHYRVSGTKLITVDVNGVVASIADIPGTGPVKMDFSFTLLGILANGVLYFWDGASLTSVTDPNMPANLTDMMWVDGYWMCTDGTNIVVTDLTAPTVVNPNKYLQINTPDTVESLLKIQNQPVVVSKNQTDLLQNIGGQFFPFAPVPTAVITKGAVGVRAACIFQDQVAFIGGARNEGYCVYLARNGQFLPVSTIEIGKTLASYSDDDLATAILESITKDNCNYLHVRLPDRTLVYDATASAVAQQPVWHVRVSTLTGFAQNRCSFATFFKGMWVVGDPLSKSIGILSDEVSTHWGADVRWEISTQMMRNETKGASIDRLELVATTGYVVPGLDPMVSTSYTLDGVKYSQDRSVRSGKNGETEKRIQWLLQGPWKNWRIQRIRGDSSSRLTAMRLIAEITPHIY